MNDRSVHAGDMHQSVVVTGDGNKVILRFGKADDITVLERRQFRCPEPRQQLAPDQRQRELDLLEPEAGRQRGFNDHGQVHVKAELATLLDLLAELNVSERGKFDRAVEAPERKPASPTPTREKSRERSSGSSNMRRKLMISTRMHQTCCRMSRRSGPGSARPAMRF